MARGRRFESASKRPNSSRRLGTFRNSEPPMVGGLAGLLSGQSGCGGYILTRKAAKKLVENHRKFDMPVDLYLCHPTLRWFKDLTIYQVDPAPVRKGCLMRDHAEAGWAQSSIAPDFFNYVPTRRRRGRPASRRIRGGLIQSGNSADRSVPLFVGFVDVAKSRFGLGNVSTNCRCSSHRLRRQRAPDSSMGG